MSDNNFDDVGRFHQRFDLHNTTFLRPGPRRWDRALMEYRVRFLEEELKEFKDALANHDDAGMFDALLDLVYVAMGTAHLQGYPWREGWDAVQEANMAKVRGTAEHNDHAKRGTQEPMVKPPGWTPPDIQGLLVGYGFPETSVVNDLECCPACKRTWEEIDRVRKGTVAEGVRVDLYGYTFCSNHCASTWYGA